jgi:hypothetical protein
MFRRHIELNDGLLLSPKHRVEGKFNAVVLALIANAAAWDWINFLGESFGWSAMLLTFCNIENVVTVIFRFLSMS